MNLLFSLAISVASAGFRSRPAGNGWAGAAAFRVSRLLWKLEPALVGGLTGCGADVLPGKRGELDVA